VAQDLHDDAGRHAWVSARRPELVRDGYEDADWDAANGRHLHVLGIRGYTDTGVIGRPSLGTSATGKAVLTSRAKSFAKHLDLLDRGHADDARTSPLPPG
jgi:creatinine amidohydrolase